MPDFTLLQAGVSPNLPGGYWIHLLLYGLGIIVVLLISVILIIWLERRLIGRFQLRPGPNRAGPFGLLQSIADVIKILTKEDIIPSRADKVVFWLAPIVAFAPAVFPLAVVPIGDGALLADLNISIVFVIAVSSITSVGVFMAGWASYNKYSLLSAMRTVAQLISYEIPLMLSMVGVIILAGSLSLNEIVLAQSVPFILLQPAGFLIFFIASLAEVNRTPFDLLEAESELVAGYHIEYSGMKFATFYLTEYCEAFVLSALTATLFLGGWQGPWLPPALWLLLKIVLVFSFIVWIRATLPRLRIDQVMQFAWKFLLPLAVLNIMVTATCVSLWPQVSVWVIGAVNLAMLIIYLLLWSRIINPGARLLLFKHFGEGIAKGMLVTFQHLIKKTVTTQYPEQRLNTSRRIRGTELAWSKQNCTACRQCEKACPHGCITIETNESRQVTVFRLDGGRCIYCGLCVESCRFNALFMGRGYERTSYLLADLTLDKEQLAVDEVIKPSAYFHPELEESLKEQTLLINGEYKA